MNLPINTPARPGAATLPAAVPSASDYRNAMARLGAAVNIITTNGPAGRAGFTASAVCSVTDSPPTLLVCLNRGASVFPTVLANGVLCVNTLGAGQQGLSQLFGGKTPSDERFAAAGWQVATTGAPVLSDAVVAFDCKLVRSTSVGSHEVLFCEVLAVQLGDAAHSLIYFDRQYHEITGH